MATASRALWKGAISFGLVHIPVSLHSATTESCVDFDWLDKRSMDPVGYKRVNKRTGREIDKSNIVKGVAYEEGEGKYVVLSPEEIDALLKKGKVGLARVVIQTKEHLAALVPAGPALVLNLLRWGADIRSWEDLKLPKEGVKAAGLSERDMTMAGQLIDELSTAWKPEDFSDKFKDQVMALVEKKAGAGETETVLPPEEEAPAKTANVIDLTELLRQSLHGGKPAAKKKRAA